MVARIVVALAFVGLVLSAAGGRVQAQESYQGVIASCVDLGDGYADASASVTVTANDGTYLSYTAADAVVAVIAGGDGYNRFPAAPSGVDLRAPLDADGKAPAIGQVLFCAIPGEEQSGGEPTCETDPTLCEEPTDEEPGTCPGGTDGYPECNPQIDAEVNLSVDCANPNPDGTYTVGGVLSVTNQSEHAQDIRITEVVGPTGDSEAFFLGQEIANGATLSYTYQSVWFAGDDPGAMMVVSASVLFESVQGRGTVREPRGDAEEFYLDAKDSCTGEEPVDEEPTCESDPSLCEPPVVDPTCETDPTLCEEPTCETDPTLCEEPVDVDPVSNEPGDEDPTTEVEEVTTLPSAGAGSAMSNAGHAGLLAVGLLALLSLAAGLRLRPQPNR